MLTALSALFLVPAALADEVPAPAPDLDPCQVWLQASIPQRNATDLPSDLKPVLFLEGGCDTAVRIELFDDDGVLHVSQDELLAGHSAIELEAPAWTPGAYAIEITDTDRFVIDRIDFWVGAEPAESVDAPLLDGASAWTDGYDTWLSLTLRGVVDNAVLSVTDADGEEHLAPAYEWTEVRVPGLGTAGEHCFSLALRGEGGDWSEPTEACIEVTDTYYDEGDDIVCGTGWPLGCSNLGSGLPASGLLLAGVFGLVRRRR